MLRGGGITRGRGSWRKGLWLGWAALLLRYWVASIAAVSFHFHFPQAENKQKSTGIKEGCMRDIRISPRRWNYALIEIIVLGIFSEIKLSQV